MVTPKAPEPSEKIGRYRWVIVSLLFAAMVINYVDRQTISLLKSDLSKEFGWSEGDYADLVFYFQLSYAVAYVAWGKIMDKIGARWGFGIAFAIWQIAHIAHAGARGLNGFIFARMGLGVGEAGGFPGGIKAVAEWFPKKERAFATGIFFAGGACLTGALIFSGTAVPPAALRIRSCSLEMSDILCSWDFADAAFNIVPAELTLVCLALSMNSSTDNPKLP